MFTDRKLGENELGEMDGTCGKSEKKKKRWRKGGYSGVFLNLSSAQNYIHCLKAVLDVLSLTLTDRNDFRQNAGESYGCQRSFIFSTQEEKEMCSRPLIPSDLL